MINTEKQHELLTFPNLSEDYSYVLEGFEENFKKLVAVAEEYPKTSVFSSYSLASFKKELLAVWGIAWNFRTERFEQVISLKDFSGYDGILNGEKCSFFEDFIENSPLKRESLISRLDTQNRLSMCLDKSESEIKSDYGLYCGFVSFLELLYMSSNTIFNYIYNDKGKQHNIANKTIKLIERSINNNDEIFQYLVNKVNVLYLTSQTTEINPPYMIKFIRNKSLPTCFFDYSRIEVVYINSTLDKINNTNAKAKFCLLGDTTSNVEFKDLNDILLNYIEYDSPLLLNKRNHSFMFLDDYDDDEVYKTLISLPVYYLIKNNITISFNKCNISSKNTELINNLNLMNYGNELIKLV